MHRVLAVRSFGIIGGGAVLAGATAISAIAPLLGENNDKTLC